MNREFTQRLRNLAKKTAFREVKKKIDAYFTLHDEVDITDEKQASFLMEQLVPFMSKDKEIHAFCKAFEHREALRQLGASEAIMKMRQSKLYSVNDQIKNRVDELVELKERGASEIRIFENYKNEVQGLVLDKFFDKYMSDVDAKHKQFRAYAYVDEAIEELGKSPNPELLGDVFQKLENAMSLPASQVPFYLIKSLTQDKHLSPVLDVLLSKLKAIDSSTQRQTMNQIRYVGNAGVYESVVAPVLFGEAADLVMLGGRLFNISEAEVAEPEEGSVDEKFVNVCRAFAQTKISESGALCVEDDNANLIEIDENAEGNLVLTVNKNITFAVDDAKEWQTELLAMQINPGMIGLVENICENLDTITSMDNIMSLSSRTGGGYTMFLIKQGASNHMVISDPVMDTVSIQKNISVKEAIDAAMDAFGADVAPFYGEESTNENAETETKMHELQSQIDECDRAIEEIQNSDEAVKEDAQVQDMLKQLEKEKSDLCSQYEQLAGQLATASN